MPPTKFRNWKRMESHTHTRVDKAPPSRKPSSEISLLSHFPFFKSLQVVSFLLSIFLSPLPTTIDFSQAVGRSAVVCCLRERSTQTELERGERKKKQEEKRDARKFWEFIEKEGGEERIVRFVRTSSPLLMLLSLPPAKADVVGGCCSLSFFSLSLSFGISCWWCRLLLLFDRRLSSLSLFYARRKQFVGLVQLFQKKMKEKLERDDRGKAKDGEKRMWQLWNGTGRLLDTICSLRFDLQKKKDGMDERFERTKRGKLKVKKK